MAKVMLLIGTRKGGFIATSSDRKSWDLRGPVFRGAEVNYMHLSAGSIYAVGKSAWWGPAIQISDDFGETWREPEESVRFAEDRGHSVERIWVIGGGAQESDPLYAGVDPGALFKSDDRGRSWQEVTTLTDHPTREKWTPGAGGLMVHSMCFDSENSDRLYVGISAAGVFRSDDAGKSWSPKNQNVRADFLPDKFPEVGQCVHHLETHTSNPEILYQQNHCGVYRSEDAGDTWIDISDGLASRFGFPMAVHPHDGDIIYVIPQEGAENRVTPDGAFRIYRSKNRGDKWETLTNGLPQENAFVSVLRSAMVTDDQDEPAIYVGTQGGQVMASFDDGDSWENLFGWFPPIYSIEAVTVHS